MFYLRIKDFLIQSTESAAKIQGLNLTFLFEFLSFRFLPYSRDLLCFYHLGLLFPCRRAEKTQELCVDNWVGSPKLAILAV